MNVSCCRTINKEPIGGFNVYKCYADEEIRRAKVDWQERQNDYCLNSIEVIVLICSDCSKE